MKRLYAKIYVVYSKDLFRIIMKFIIAKYFEFSNYWSQEAVKSEFMFYQVVMRCIAEQKKVGGESNWQMILRLG